MHSSAPSDLAKSNFESDEQAAITLAPMAFPICTAALPVPPAAPRTTKVSFFFKLAFCLSAWCAVPVAARSAAPSSKERFSGSLLTIFSLKTTFSAKAPNA